MYNNYEYDIMKALYDEKEAHVDMIRNKIGKEKWDVDKHYDAIDSLVASNDIIKVIRNRMWYKKTQVIGDHKI